MSSFHFFTKNKRVLLHALKVLNMFSTCVCLGVCMYNPLEQLKTHKTLEYLHKFTTFHTQILQ